LKKVFQPIFKRICGLFSKNLPDWGDFWKRVPSRVEKGLGFLKGIFFVEKFFSVMILSFEVKIFWKRLGLTFDDKEDQRQDVKAHEVSCFLVYREKVITIKLLLVLYWTNSIRVFRFHLCLFTIYLKVTVLKLSFQKISRKKILWKFNFGIFLPKFFFRQNERRREINQNREMINPQSSTSRDWEGFEGEKINFCF